MNDICNSFPGYAFCTWYDYYKKYPEYIPEENTLDDFKSDATVRNLYRGTDLGFGGYVYAEPGMYTNVALIDISSMHPSSILAMNCFGEYTKNYADIKQARVYIKHGEYDKARELFGGRLGKYLDDPSTAKDLSQALKIALNSCYGLTSANFDNPFRDVRNKNNIVALRGALFMRTLQDEVRARGFTVCHIKTDSIKVANATPEIIQFCMDFAQKYSYTFEHEATYEKMCLVNGSTYIAKYSKDESINGKHAGQWTATAAQFQVPYVFKYLFSKEPIVFEDMCETKSVSTAIYLDMNEEGALPFDNGTGSDEYHNYIFVGKIGQFCPIKPGHGGGLLVRSATDKEGNVKYDSVTGAKDYRWLESERVKAYGSMDDIDRSYYQKLVDDAVAAISEYGDFEWFVSDDPVPQVAPWFAAENPEDLPWKAACGKDTCIGCEHFPKDHTKNTCLAGYDISDYNSLYDDATLFNVR